MLLLKANHPIFSLKESRYSPIWQNPFTLFICFLLVVSFRFNRNDLVIKRPLNDAAYYIANVQMHRGETPAYRYKGPFNERILVTLVAAVLPFEPLTAINLSNIIFLVIALLFLSKTLQTFQLPGRFHWLGMYLFVFSFPTFYYSTIGYTDPGVLAMLFMGAYALFANKYGLFLWAVALGTLAKEGIVVLFPVVVTYALCRENYRWLGIAVVSLLLFLSLTFLIKSWVSEGGNRPFYWKPLPNRVQFNLARPNFYLSTLLGLGVPWLLCVVLFIKNFRSVLNHWKEDAPLWVGTLFSFLPWLYMIFSAFPDGRIFWVSYCFPISLAMVWSDRYGLPFLKTT